MLRPQLSHEQPSRQSEPHPSRLCPSPHQLPQRLWTLSCLCLPSLLRSTNCGRSLPLLLPLPVPMPLLISCCLEAKLGQGCMAVPGWSLVKGQAGHLQHWLVWLVGDDHPLPGDGEQHLSWLDCICGCEAPLTPTPGIAALLARRCCCLWVLLSVVNGVRGIWGVQKEAFLHLVMLDTPNRLPFLQSKVLSPCLFVVAISAGDKLWQLWMYLRVPLLQRQWLSARTHVCHLGNNRYCQCKDGLNH